LHSASSCAWPTPPCPPSCPNYRTRSGR
jgi:hypothetical protein